MAWHSNQLETLELELNVCPRIAQHVSCQKLTRCVEGQGQRLKRVGESAI